MRSSITFKLFLAILATCLAVALAMGMAVRYSFDSGFDDYVQEREHQRLDTLSQLLASDYAESGGWQFLAGRQDRWWRSLRLSRRDLPLGEHPHGAQPLRVTLVDAQGDWLAGPRARPGADIRRVPVVVEGQTVGWLMTPPLVSRAVNDEIDRQFQARQLRATWVIVGLSVLLAAVVSLLLARILLVPVRRMARATHRLASGDYQTRVRVGTPDELGRLARDFNRLAHNLERHEQWRRELMADVSHELRTPLSVLRGEIEALQDGLRPLDAGALGSLAHEVKQLSDLIDDLYELSLADAGALNYHMKPVDLSVLVAQAVDAVRDRFQRGGLSIDVRIEPGLALQGDEKRLLQLMSNLLENSLRYTDSPGQVKILACRTRDAIELEIADSAPGVGAEHLPRLFERLYRAEASRSRQHGGAGLGLAICRRIVQAHGGRIAASPSALGGLAIHITWPAVPGKES
ncbi:sensor histidine kinase efflux regulator BaeS [Castellaniella sp. MT123]|uniref:sensor histidine kinase efflux regulator BaeS n=1 Tax=Castellaniella sp. MT123 TaxID=3140381 RepID=UPI0031F44938|nr:sensor histidine kinase efflux regulator BaeS [Castellaniella sp.]